MSLISTINKPLYVVTGVFNPARYQSRYRHYKNFEKYIEQSGAILITVECAFKGRPFEVTEKDNPNHVQVRSEQEIWLKENLMNIGVAHLPEEAEYVAFIDADITFSRHDWVHETIQKLQHHEVVQMFTTVNYTGPDHEFLANRLGFAESWFRGIPILYKDGEDIKSAQSWYRGKCAQHFTDEQLRAMGHDFHEAYEIITKAKLAPRRVKMGAPGFAWAWRKSALDQVGGLLEDCILGSGDHFQAAGLTGHMADVIPHEYSQDFKNYLMDWEKRARYHLRGNFGVVDNILTHYWHGRLALRKYGEREKILKKWDYSPYRDIRKNTHGVISLVDDGTDRFIGFRDDLRAYFSGRDEDSRQL